MIAGLAWYYRLAAVLALMAGAVLGYRVWENHVYQQGYKTANDEATTREAKISAEATARHAAAAGDAWTRERELRDDFAAVETKRFKENAEHEKINAALLARARAGELRLSIPVKPCPVSGNAPATGAAATPGPGDETRTDLLPATVERIFSIAGRSASDVRDYNALLELYNRARATCNAVTP